MRLFIEEVLNMDKIINWFNEGSEVCMTITDKRSFRCSTILGIDNLVFNGEYINIMAGDIDIDINTAAFQDIPGGIYYEEGDLEIELLTL